MAFRNEIVRKKLWVPLSTSEYFTVPTKQPPEQEKERRETLKGISQITYYNIMNINNREYKFSCELRIARFWIPSSRLLRLLGNFTVNSVFPYECLKKGEGFGKLNLKHFLCALDRKF